MAWQFPYIEGREYTFKKGGGEYHFKCDDGVWVQEDNKPFLKISKNPYREQLKGGIMAENQWRPDNHKEIKKKYIGNAFGGDYETGFDACLEALRDARFPYTGGQFAGIDITKEGDFLIILKS